MDNPGMVGQEPNARSDGNGTNPRVGGGSSGNYDTKRRLECHSTSCWRKRTWRIPPVHLKLYCRPTFHKQFESYGLDSRPSGTGKSTTTMAFASTLDRNEWIVSWIHVSKLMDWQCVRTN
ncbi:hypothetical protein GQ600_25446 [Phytophthora cactorum]|nr:hypothetical protein GQ600_25446 [Phytophthora cactorum]